MTDQQDISDILDVPAGVDLEEDPFGYAPAHAKPKEASLIPVLISVTDATISNLSERFLGLKINGVQDAKGLARCKAAKKECTDVRLCIEKSRVDLKAPHLEAGRAIDKEAKRLQELLEPTESYITAQIETVEKSLRKIEQERLDRLYEKRRGELEAINLHLPEASVRAMSDEEFENLIERSLQEFEEQQEESQRRAEEQRKLDAERAKQRAEADRLVAERVEIQRKQDEADAEIRRKQEELAAQQRAFRKQQDDAAQAEADRLAAIERERREAAEAIEREKQLAEAKARAERMKPFIEQLDAFSARLMELAKEVPTIDPEIDEEVSSVVIDAAIDIHNIVERLVSLAPVPAVEISEFSDI